MELGEQYLIKEMRHSPQCYSRVILQAVQKAVDLVLRDISIQLGQVGVEICTGIKGDAGTTSLWVLGEDLAGVF